MPAIDYTDNDARRLLEALAKYAEAFAADHSDADVTVKELADDLADSCDDASMVAQLQELRDRVYDGLNNNVGGTEFNDVVRGQFDAPDND